MAVSPMTAQAFRTDPGPADPSAPRPPALRPPCLRLAAADAADGWLARQVARAAGSFEHGLLGRAPTSVTVVGTGAWMVVYLHVPFSALERQLAATDRAGARRVCEFHHALFRRTAGPLCEHVRLATGVALAAAIAHVDTATGSVLKTLATSAEVDLFLLGAGVPALGVPVNEHRRAVVPHADDEAAAPDHALNRASNHELGPSLAAGIGAGCP
jgi:uncharacterized protein YbcI